MNKFNRKFTKACTRCSFWQALCNHFNGFVDLLKAPDALTHEDRKILRDIHALLVECYKASKARKIFHSNELHRLRKDFNKLCR